EATRSEPASEHCREETAGWRAGVGGARGIRAVAAGRRPARASDRGRQLSGRHATARRDRDRATARRESAHGAPRARGARRSRLRAAERGSGTYVETRRLRYPISSRTRFSEIVGAAGREPGGRLLASVSQEAGPDVARRLAVAPRTKVIRLDILRSVDRVPVSAATTWLPAERAPDVGRIYRDTRSLTRTLAQLGIDDYRRQSTRISAAIA